MFHIAQNIHLLLENDDKIGTNPIESQEQDQERDIYFAGETFHFRSAENLQCRTLTFGQLMFGKRWGLVHYSFMKKYVVHLIVLSCFIWVVTILFPNFYSTFPSLFILCAIWSTANVDVAVYLLLSFDFLFLLGNLAIFTITDCMIE